MKKRLFSGFLALVMVLGLLPGTAWAEETGSTTGSMETTTGDTGSGGGGGSSQWKSPIQGIGISGAVWNNRAQVIAYSENAENKISGSIQALVSAATDEDDRPVYVDFYFPESNLMTDEPTRRVSFFSSAQLDPSKIKAGQGITLASGFQETVLGSGADVLYLYQGLVTFHMFQAMFYYGEGEQADLSGGNANAEQLAMLYTSSLPEADAKNLYVGEIYVRSADGDNLTVEITGANLPTGNDAVGQFVIRDSVGADYNHLPPIYTCTAYDAAHSDPEHGVYAYIMSRTSNQIQGNSWFPLYIGETQASFYNGDGATLPTLTPMSQSGGSGNSVSVKGGTTTTASAAVTITNSGYTQMRYTVNSGAYTDWMAISSSVSIPTPSVGSYTVSFEFRSDSGAVVSRSTTVTRQTTAVLAAPVNVGIADYNTNKIVTPGSDGTYSLMGSHDYLLYADLADVAVADKTGRTILVNDKYTLIWKSGKKRYEGTLNADSFGGITSLVFRAKQEASDASAHGAETLSVHVTDAPKVYYGNTPWVPSTYEDGTYLVRPETKIDCYFVGDSGDGITGWAELTYKVNDTISNNVTMARVQMTNNSGTYTGTVTAPAKDSDATGLVSIAYYLESGGQKSQVLSYTLSNYRMASVMTFSGFTASAVDANNNSLGDYSGVNVEIRRTKDGNTENYYRYGHVGNDGTLELDQVDLNDGATYTCIIRGASGRIAETTLTADDNGEYTPASPMSGR